jgi:hypothetical protein
LADQLAPVAEKTEQGRLTGNRLPAGTAGIWRGIDVGGAALLIPINDKEKSSVPGAGAGAVHAKPPGT